MRMPKFTHGRMTLAVGTMTLALAAVCLDGCNDPTILHRNAGLRAYDSGNLDDAESDFVACIKDTPSDWKSMWYLSKIRIKQGKYAEAQVTLERVLVLRSDWPETPDIEDDLAESIYRQNDLEGLANMLQTAAYKHGSIRDFRRQAKYLGLINDVDGAKLAYQKLIRFTGPKNPTAYISLADYLKYIGDSQGEILALRKAHYINPDNMIVADRLRKYGIVPGPAAALQPSPEEFKPIPEPVITPPATGPGSKSLLGRPKFD